MYFLDSSSGEVMEFMMKMLVGLSSIIGFPKVSTTPYKPEPKLAAEVGVLSGVSYEQPIGGKFSAVGKLGLSMSDEETLGRMRDFNQLPNSDCVGILQELPKTATTKAVILRFVRNGHIREWHLSSPTPKSITNSIPIV